MNILDKFIDWTLKSKFTFKNAIAEELNFSNYGINRKPQPKIHAHDKNVEQSSPHSHTTLDSYQLAT